MTGQTLGGASPLISSAAEMAAIAAPADGMQIFYLADATNGIVWHLRYRGSSSSAYKWEYLGGGALADDIATGESTSSTSYVNLTTTGPSVTVPLAGDYEIRLSCAIQPGSDLAIMSYAVGAATALDADAIYQGKAATVWGTPSRAAVKTGLAAATALVGKYRVLAGSAGTFEHRRLELRPIRVG